MELKYSSQVYACHCLTRAVLHFFAEKSSDDISLFLISRKD